MTASPLDQSVDVETPELVTLTYSLAGVGARLMAALVDVLICVTAFIALLTGIAMLDNSPSRRSGPPGESMSSSVVFAIFVLLIFAVQWGYFVLFEGLWDGQTPGKRLYRLRVVRDGGFSVTFGVSAVRNLLRIVDMHPGIAYVFGLVSVLLTRRSRRLGDIAAGTIVVHERVLHIEAVRRVDTRADAAPLHTALSEQQYRTLERYVDRYGSLGPDQRNAMAVRLAGLFGSAMPASDATVAAQLIQLHERERSARAQGVAPRGETGAGRERQAIIALGKPQWQSFATRLARAQAGGLVALGESGVRAFVADYRSIAADLARLRTAASGRQIDELFYVGRLVAGAHNLIYRDAGLSIRSTLNFVFRVAPTEVRRSWRPIGLAALLLFGPALISGVALVRQPALAHQIVGEAMIDRANRGVRRAQSGEGYIDDPGIFRPVMSSRIIANNVQVTIAAFAGGITLGVITVVLLLFNGISIGGVFGLYASKGILPLIIAFVAPHSAFELTAICIGGGAGLLLAAGIVLPGDRTRRRAIVENGRRAGLLMTTVVLLLLLAGLLEGLVSPIPWWPLEGKLAVGGSCVALLYLYLRGGAGIRARPVPLASDTDSPRQSPRHPEPRPAPRCPRRASAVARRRVR